MLKPPDPRHHLTVPLCILNLSPPLRASLFLFRVPQILSCFVEVVTLFCYYFRFSFLSFVLRLAFLFFESFFICREFVVVVMGTNSSRIEQG